MSEYTDWLGQPIEVGSPVLYAVSNGHYAEVVWGEVLEIIPVEPRLRNIYSEDPEEREKPMYQRKVIREEEYWDYGRRFRLKVQPYYQNSDFREDATVSGWGTRGVEYGRDENDQSVLKRALPKPVTVKNVEKVTVFPLPEGTRDRLERLLDEGVDSANKRMKDYRAR